MRRRRTRKPARLIFAENMRKARQERGLTQEELAEIVGLHRTYVGSVERGERNVSVDNMEAIAQALEEKLPDLLTEKP